MHGETWIATRDIDEPNLRVKAGSPLPDRFQSNYVVKSQLMPFLGDGSFKLVDPKSGGIDGGTDQKRMESLEQQVAELRASNDLLREQLEKIQGGGRKGKGADREG